MKAGRYIDVVVRAGARQERIEERNGVIRIYTQVAPEKGRANERVQVLLAKHLHIPKTCLQLVKGKTSSKKRFFVGSEFL